MKATVHISNEREEGLRVEFGNGRAVVGSPGESVEVDLPGDHLGILAAYKGVTVDCPEWDTDPPEGSKKALQAAKAADEAKNKAKAAGKAAAGKVDPKAKAGLGASLAAGG